MLAHVYPWATSPSGGRLRGWPEHRGQRPELTAHRRHDATAQLDRKRAVVAQARGARGHELAVRVETVTGREDRVRRLIRDVLVEPRLCSGQVREVGDDEVERAVNRVEEARVQHGDTIGETAGARRCARASSTASALESVATTSARGSATASAAAIAPEPVPTSAIRSGRSDGATATAASTSRSLVARGVITRPAAVATPRPWNVTRSMHRLRPHGPTSYAR